MDRLKQLSPAQLQALSPEQIKAILEANVPEPKHAEQIAAPEVPVISEQMIINFLSANHGRYKASDIALNIGIPRPFNTAKNINKHLYELQKKGQIQCEINENKTPMWFIMH